MGQAGRSVRALAVWLLFTLAVAACEEPEYALTRIDESIALPEARRAWTDAKRLALKMNTEEGPSALLLGLRRSIAASLNYDNDAVLLDSICGVWGPIWAQIVWGPMTNRVYSNQKQLLPCSVYQSRSSLMFNISFVEELSNYKLGDRPAPNR